MTSRDKISFGCKAIDDLFKGGIKRNKPFCIFGRSMIGKTWMCMQIATYFTTYDKRKVLYLNTEADFDGEEFDRLAGYFKDRWNTVDIDRIEVKDLRDVWELGEYFGMQVEIYQSEKRTEVVIKYPKRKGRDVKTSSKMRDWWKYSPFFNDVQSGKYGLIILDSLSLPIKTEIGRGTQNLPARATLQSPLLGTLLTLSGKYHVPTIFTVHASVNPQGKSWDKPFGGDDIKFYTKYIMGILPPVKSEIPSKYQNLWQRFRRIWRFRYGFLEQKMILVVLAKDYGYVDMSYLAGGRIR